MIDINSIGHHNNTENKIVIMKIITEFKKFAMRGNVIDMAIGIIIGGAFGKIVSSFVSDILMPPLGLLLGGVNFTDLKITLKQAVTEAGDTIVPAVTLNYGMFIQVTIDFLIIAFAIFMMVKAMNTLSPQKEEAPSPVGPSEDITLLTEIRDLLRKSSKD